jgi:hypothetical protein
MQLPNVMTGANAGEAFVVLKASPTTSQGALWSWSTDTIYGATMSKYTSNDNSITENFGTSGVYNLGTVNKSLSAFHLYNVSAQAGDWQARINGVVLYHSASNTVAFPMSPWIGADHYGYIDPYVGYCGGTSGFEGDIAEVIIYDHALSSVERDAVSRFLAIKYNLYTVPTAPTGLTATALSSSQINLGWDAMTRPDQMTYEIERKSGDGNYAKIAETTVASYVDTNLNAQTL